MDKKIGVSKAARLLGIPRADLNKRLAAAGIPTFEGEVDFDKVQCIAPTLNFADPEAERIRHIRENPAKRVKGHETALSKQDLLDEIARLSSQLRVEAMTALEYRKIIEDTSERLGRMQTSGNDTEREAAFALCSWLRERIASE